MASSFQRTAGSPAYSLIECQWIGEGRLDFACGDFSIRMGP